MPPESAPLPASFKPLLTAAAANPALEEMALDARDEILMGFRLFEAELPLQSPRAREAGYSTWSELLAARAADGVRVRILLTDFEPIVANTLHAQAWSALEGFVKAGDAAGAGDNLSVIAGLHPGELGKIIRLVFWPALRFRLHRVRKKAERDNDQDLAHTPGLRAYLRRKGRALKVQNFPSARLWPATYHQKMAVFDGTRAVIGGIDLAERMADTPAHDRPADETWHDVSVAVEGDVAAAARAHLKAEWNANTPRFNARLTRMGAPFEQMLRPVAPILDDAPKLSPPSLDRGVFLRTRSRRSRSPFAIGPRPDVIEIERSSIKAILGAERLIYLETQFLRSPVIVQALVRTASRTTSSQLIIVLPAAPDDIAFDDNRGADARQGEWLQVRAIRRIQKAWGDRCGMFSLAQPRPVSADENALLDRATLQDAPIVYVHAKVSIFDSRDAIVGSANLNGRSMRWDTETAVHWRDKESVQTLQNALWTAHFGHAVDAESAEPLRAWSTRAQENAACAPEQRQGFIMPYDLEAAAKTAKYRCWVPTNMV